MDTDKQLGEDIHRVRSGSQPRNFCPHRVGECYLPGVNVLTNQEAPQTPYWDFYGGFLTEVWSIIYSTSSPSRLSREVGRGGGWGEFAENPNLQISLVFLVTSPDLGAT